VPALCGIKEQALSALTKIFVVLLVILSLLLAAAGVTFLNTLPDFQAQLETLTAANQAAQTSASRATSASQSEITALNSRIQAISAQMSQASNQVADLRAQLGKAEAEKADLQGQLAQGNATQTVLAQTVQANTALVNELRTQLASLRTDYDGTLQQLTDTNRSLAEASNQVTYLTRSLRRTQEENKDLLSRVDELTGRLLARGEDPNTVGPLDAPAPPINGIVLRVDQIGGRDYALISVGSEDDVRPGMRFTVLNENEFLGYLTIEEVEDTQSIGQLSGPNIAAVGPDAEVRTQI
jgi:septal ring factor EnvC (AmiA/AmiB activator)